MGVSTETALATSKSKKGSAKSNSRGSKANPSPRLVDPISFLQRTVGNREVERLLKSRVIQAKRKVNRPGDIYEQEADRISDQVAGVSTHGGGASRVQRAAEQVAGETEQPPLGWSMSW